MLGGPLSDDGQVILLLCTPLALPKNAVSPLQRLSTREWNAVAESIQASDWPSPGALLGRMAEEMQSELGLDTALARRAAALLERGGQLGIAVSQLAEKGIWILTREDDEYPDKLRQRLGKRAPPVLFGAGPIALLSTPGIAIVGSRSVDQACIDYTSELALLCAQAKQTVYSGGARGVDRISMGASLEEGGCTVGVVAESLERMIAQRETRQPILDEHLTLITPYLPSAPFNVGNAMGRNKLIYALADFAVVVESSHEKGGTWSGAKENLSKGWVPLFVRPSQADGSGNRRLIERGAIPLPLESLSGERSIDETLADMARSRKATPLPRPAPRPSDEQFATLWPEMEEFLSTPRTLKEIIEELGITRYRAEKCLKSAAAENKAQVIKGGRSNLYQSTASQEPYPEQGQLC